MTCSPKFQLSGPLSPPRLRTENTGSLLTYLSDLEKDVDGKKYGLVFEEHQEAIDAVLAEHTPVLTEEKPLLSTTAAR